MILLRYVSTFVADWKAVLSRGWTGGELPHWAVGAFTPSEKDKGRLSLFAADDVTSPRSVAAALAFNRHKVEPHLFVTAEADTLEEAGLEITKTEGGTDHPSVNDRHYEVVLGTLEDISAVTSAFLHGSMEFVDIKEINAQLLADARSDSIDWMHLAIEAHSQAWAKSMSFVKGRAVEMNGIPIQVGA